MALHWYDGKAPAREIAPAITLNRVGQVYLNAGLVRKLRPEQRQFRLGWDPERRLFALVPQVKKSPGTAKGHNDKGGNHMRLSCRNFLHLWGLMPKERYTVAAAWTGERIEATIPADEVRGLKDTGCPAGAKGTPVKETGTAMKDGDLVTLAEACAAHGISQARFYQLDRKNFPKTNGKRGHAPLYRRAEVDAWFASRTIGKRPPRPEKSPADPDLVTAEDIARVFGYTVNWFYGLRQRHKDFPAPVRTVGPRGKRHYYSRKAVQNYCRRHNIEPRGGTPAQPELEPEQPRRERRLHYQPPVDGAAASPDKECCGNCCWLSLTQCTRGRNAGKNRRDDAPACRSYNRKRTGPPAGGEPRRQARKDFDPFEDAN